MSDRQTKVDRYLRAATIGTVAVAILPPLYLAMLALPQEDYDVLTAIWALVLLLLAAFSIIGAIYSFIYMFVRRATDEYTLSMWHTGTTVAFFAVIGWLLIGDLVQTAINVTVMSSGPEMVDPDYRFVSDWAAWVVCVAFFVGFHLKRMRG